LELHELFPGEALAALDLCDRAGVSALVSPSGRRIYRCRAGPSATPYLVSNTGYVCTCAAYKFAPMGQRQRIGEHRLFPVESGYIIHGIHHPAAYIGHFRSEPNFYTTKPSGYIIQPSGYISHFERCEREHLRA